VKDFGLTPYDAEVLIMDQNSAAYFEDVAKGRDGKMAANWVINELFGRLNKEGTDIADSPISADQLGAIRDMIRQHHLRQDRQGRVRDRLDRRRRPEANR
jgi:aspartyl-tRNA(Asn)/glutamyl-tRNA(Gln) amidotransferase subunit B